MLECPECHSTRIEYTGMQANAVFRAKGDYVFRFDVLAYQCCDCQTAFTQEQFVHAVKLHEISHDANVEVGGNE